MIKIVQKEIRVIRNPDASGRVKTFSQVVICVIHQLNLIKNMKNIKIYTCVLVLFLLNGCTKDFAIINTNNNAPTKNNPATLLPSGTLFDKKFTVVFVLSEDSASNHLHLIK